MKRHSGWRVLCGLLTLAIAASSYAPAAAQGASLASTYATVKRSLGLVAYRSGKYLVTGSAFCVGHGALKDGKPISFLLTNAHVVGAQRGVFVSLASDQRKWQPGQVVRTNPGLDLALVAVAGTVPALQLASTPLAEGSTIAIAGYPGSSVQFALAGYGLSPAVHQGIVNSYEAGGHLMIFDAQVERGNSGGPVFDPTTGIVYAIVEAKVGQDQTNVGIAISNAFAFLQNARIALFNAASDRAVAQAPPVAATPAAPTVPASPATIAEKLPGNVTEVLTNPSQLGSENFGVEVPLIVRDQHYRCSDGADMTVRIRPAGAADFLVVRQFAAPLNQFDSAILRHDANGDLLFVGYVARDGSVKGPRDATLLLPVHHPAAGRTIPIESDGAAGVRMWLGSGVIQTTENRYDVQVYQDTVGANITRVAYSNQVGLVGILFESDQSSTVRTCELESIAAH